MSTSWGMRSWRCFNCTSMSARNGAVGAKTIDDKIAAENQLSSALAGLKITLEAYPDLKANQNFLQLQEEISDVENKLAAVRLL